MRYEYEGANEALKFSICVPVYNVESFLEECIQSVIKQTYKNYELILVDDGSTDFSGQICDEYALKDSRIKVVHKNNQGLLHTRRYAVEISTGDYCVFLDSDDYLELDALEKIANTICNHCCDCVVFGIAKVCNGKTLSIITEKEEVLLEDKKELYKKCLFSSTYNSVCRKAVKRTKVNNLDYSKCFHISLGEDLLQTLDILKHCNRVAFIKDVLYNYRVNMNSMTHTICYDNEDLINSSVRMRSLLFLKDEDIFDNIDFAEYRVYCIELLLQKVHAIAQSNDHFEKKIDIFNRIKRSEYYINFINKGNTFSLGIKLGTLFCLYNKGYYKSLIFVMNIRDKIIGLWRKL